MQHKTRAPFPRIIYFFFTSGSSRAIRVTPTTQVLPSTQFYIKAGKILLQIVHYFVFGESQKKNEGRNGEKKTKRGGQTDAEKSMRRLLNARLSLRKH